MNFTKWFLLIPALSFISIVAGCGPDTGTKVIEAPVQTAEEIAEADTAYEQESGKSTQGYEN